MQISVNLCKHISINYVQVDTRAVWKVRSCCKDIRSNSLDGIAEKKVATDWISLALLGSVVRFMCLVSSSRPTRTGPQDFRHVPKTYNIYIYIYIYNV